MAVGLDLEADGLAAVDADVGGEALDARVAGAVTSHSLGGFPGLEFSQAIGFDPHGAASALSAPRASAPRKRERIATAAAASFAILEKNVLCEAFLHHKPCAVQSHD